jgi:hypothetical protein
MRLIDSVDLTKFLQTVRSCHKDVLFTTDAGDILNLKSELSCFVFAVASGNSSIIKQGKIVCQDPNDTRLLKCFLTE